MGNIEEFYKAEYSNLVKLVYRTTKDVGGAEDVVQDAFVNTMKYYHSFNPSIATFDKWFSGILWSCTKAWQRDQRMSGMTVEITEDIMVTSETLNEDHKLVYEIKRMVDEETSLMTRQVCYLHFIEQYTPREIVKVVPTTAGYVRKVLCNFRKRLKGVYGDE